MIYKNLSQTEKINFHKKKLDIYNNKVTYLINFIKYNLHISINYFDFYDYYSFKRC